MELSKKIKGDVESVVRERFGDSFESVTFVIDREEEIVTVYVRTKPRKKTADLFGLTSKIRSALGDKHSELFPVIRSEEIHA